MDHYYKENFEEILDIFCIAAEGGAFSVRMDENFTLLYGNDSYYNIHEYTRDGMLREIENKCVRYVHPDDLEGVRNYCRRSVEQGKTRVEWEMRVITGRGNIKYVKCAGATAMLNGDPVMHGFVLDITEKKNLLTENTLSENAIQIAIAQTNIALWTYDMQNKRIIQDRNSRKAFGFDPIVNHVPDCFWGTGVIHPSDEIHIKKMYQELFAGKKTAESVARWKSPVTGEYRWAKIRYTAVLDESGVATKAIGSAIDVSEQRTMQELHESQMSYKNIMEDNIMGSFRLNLSQNLCSGGQSVFPYLLKLQEDGTVDGFFQRVYPDIPEKAQRQQYSSIFSKENMIASFYAGTTRLSVEHLFKVSEDRYEWITTHANIIKNPVTGDIESLIYAFNIHYTKMLRFMMEHTVENDYDYVAMVNAQNERHIEILNKKSTAILPQVNLEKYTDVTAQLVAQENAPEDQERIMQQKSLANITEHLRHAESYIITYTARQKDGSIGHKRVRYSYFDRAAGLIVFSATDITQEIEAEQKKNELLSAALTAAKQANSAKTDFLSRMSHEIRTPMNAIIGMSAIAAHSLDDPSQVADCISKIGISSRFLLSLINDILDMSRIESGKVLLKSEKIPFTELIGSINSICYDQARAKDIDYECIVDSTVEDSYLGDAMKLQQVLINILSNAIKFTNAKGRVSMDIKQLRKTSDHAELRFSINDTGCGISKEFLPALFDPFSQEYSGTTATYSGTGLGLAICKNLVELMDGKIEVRSIVDVGTEFTVTVKLGITEETRASYIKKMAYHFEKLSALVVDDDITICQYAMMTLKEIGITAEWVDSGKKAVSLVREKWASRLYYDLILLDWKMPEMDGIETARKIRKIVGPDVTIIIMTAYDWTSIEHEAKLAGVNLLISKPLFKSSLVSAFHKAFHEKCEETAKVESIEFNFTGRKILLVEDHPLNVEVAKKLLERKGFTVEHAGNGLRAIEMVTLACEDYYDAILMDIRMPIMDGLQAAKGIRNLNKKSAKTVPIIAMTANAFDDDMDKSKKAGMNAHLAKPIDPTQLYSTLYHYISGESETIK